MFERLKQELERHRRRPFLEAAMAACALIASADDEVSFSERARMDAVLESLAELRIFDPHQAVDLFNARIEALQADREAGRQRHAHGKQRDRVHVARPLQERQQQRTPEHGHQQYMDNIARDRMQSRRDGLYRDKSER